jgi:hypothetical protein
MSRMLIDLLGLAMSGVDRLIRVRPSRWRARRMHTRLRSEPGLAMPHGWHAGQAFARISSSAARTFWCKVPMILS